MLTFIKKGLVVILGVFFAAGATIYLDETIHTRVVLFLIFSVLNLIAFNDLAMTKNIVKVLIKDSHTPIPTWLEMLGGIVGVIWTLQLTPELPFLETTIWIITNTVCSVSCLYVIYKFVRRFLPRQK